MFFRSKVSVAWSLGELEIPLKYSKDFIVPIVVSVGRSKREVFGEGELLPN